MVESCNWLPYNAKRKEFSVPVFVLWYLKKSIKQHQVSSIKLQATNTLVYCVGLLHP